MLASWNTVGTIGRSSRAEYASASSPVASSGGTMGIRGIAPPLAAPRRRLTAPSLDASSGGRVSPISIMLSRLERNLYSCNILHPMPVVDITAPPLAPEELADRLRRAPWRRYVAIGDSLTEGLGDPVDGYPDMTWPEATAHAFQQLHPDFKFLNLGKRYLTARQVRETQLQPALDFEPDLVTVLAGGNDLGDPFDPEGIERELDTMVAALIDTGATVCTMGIPNVVRCGRIPERMAEILGPRLAAHHEISERIAERHDTVFIDYFDHPMSEDPSTVSDDLVHPNKRGQAMVADGVLQGLAS